MKSTEKLNKTIFNLILSIINFKAKLLVFYEAYNIDKLCVLTTAIQHVSAVWTWGIKEEKYLKATRTMKRFDQTAEYKVSSNIRSISIHW